MLRGGALLVALCAFAALPALAAGAARSTSQTPVLFNADEIQYDQDLGLTIARGHVELDQGSDILLADAVTYNQRSDTVTASGHVSLLQPTGDIMFADYAELHDRMRDGFIKDIRLLLSDGSRLAGNTARRVAGIRTTIRRAVYSPCELCQDDPTRPPVWQIKAEEVVHDKDLQLVEYHDAVMEIDGIPVLYSPYFSHPDPSVKRASGFLPPQFGFGNTLGFHAMLPYYWDIAPDKDLTLRPMFTTGAGDVLGAEYRERFANGFIDNDASVEAGGPTESASAANVGPSANSVRWDVMGTGEFDINDNWRTAYQVQRESDQAYMLFYHFLTPPNYLTSHAYAEDFGENSYGNVSAYSFQSLSPYYGDSLEPVVLPDARYSWTSETDRLGGRWLLDTSALDLIHHTGPEVRRVSGGAAWELPFNGAIGDRFTFTASARSDAYDSDHVPLAPNLQPVTTEFGETLALPTNIDTTTATDARVFPQMALKWRYPLVRVTPSGSTLIEPIAAVIVGPNGENPARIPDEDAQGFEYDETSLFVPNRLPGYDRVDSGQRVDYGIHGAVDGLKGQSFETLVGQSYRLEQNDFFPVGSGLNDRLSDIVGRFVVSPNIYSDVFYRFRLDKSDFAARRQEAGVTTGTANLRLSASFIAVQPIFQPNVTAAQPGEQIAGTITATLTRYWSLALNDTRSIGNGGATINAGMSATYHDDCFAVVSSITQSGVRVGDVRPGVSVLVTLVFKNLGAIGERLLSENGT